MTTEIEYKGQKRSIEPIVKYIQLALEQNITKIKTLDLGLVMFVFEFDDDSALMEANRVTGRIGVILKADFIKVSDPALVTQLEQICVAENKNTPILVRIPTPSLTSDLQLIVPVNISFHQALLPGRPS